jgi:hypothetical protein
MTRRAAAFASVLALSGLVACGGKGPAAGGEGKPDVDADPLALLPAAAVLVARVDARAVYASAAIGAELAALGDALVPLGDESGFRASRDVDQVVLAAYSTSNLDVAAVLRGRFDVDRIAHTTKSKSAAPVAAGTYAGLAIYSTGRVAWAPLTPRTLVAGTAEGVHGVLDRIAKGKLDRWEPPWMTGTLETPTAQLAVVGDFGTQPIAAAAIGSVSLPWVKGIRAVRAVGVLEPGGLDLTATLTYPDPAQAREAAGGIQRADQLLDLFGSLLGGLRLQRFNVTLDAQDVRCSFTVDPQGLHTLVAIAPRFVAPPTP